MEYVKFRRKKSLMLENLLMLYLISISGFASFFQYSGSIYIVSIFVLWLFFHRNINIPRSGWITIASIFAIHFIQYIVHNGSPMQVITQTFVFFILMLLAMIFGDNIPKVYITVMKWICMIAFSLWLLCLVPGIKSAMISLASILPELRSSEFLDTTVFPSKSLWIYNIALDSIKNAGPFWEPGMFAVFISLALIMNMLKGTKLLDRNNFFFLAGLITTFSTSGYIALIILVISYLFANSKSMLVKVLSLLILPLVLPYIWQLDFMSDKIEQNMEMADMSFSRFGAITYHIEKIELSPIVGWGICPWPDTAMDRFMKYVDKVISPNGISLIFVYWGIPYAIFFFACLFLFLRRTISGRNPVLYIISFVAMLAVVFSQDVTNRFIYKMLFLYGACSISISQKNNKYDKYDSRQTTEKSRYSELLSVP